MSHFFNTHIPPEILQQAVSQLDPISLIALSQTSKSWRAFINPNQHDYVQRLLALELTPEHGGIVPLFDEVAQKLSPPWDRDGDEWKSNKYACCGCMKLRSHMLFANHAILRRPYRKPPPGSVEADKAAITDWEPLELSVRWMHIQERAALERRERRRWTSIAWWKRDNVLANPPAHQFASVPRPPDSEDGEYEIRRYLTGTARQRRRCVECRLLNIRRKPSTTHAGPRTEVAAVVSRQGLFLDHWDRHFPGLVEPPPPEKRPRQWRVMRGSRPGALLNVHVVFCPSCKTWLMDSAFRNWRLLLKHETPRPTTSAEDLDFIICNRCHLERYQDPSRLARELSAWALAMFREHRSKLHNQLGFGWSYIYHDFVHPIHAFGMFDEISDIGYEIIAGLKWDSADKVYGNKRPLLFDESDLPELRRRFERYRELIYSDKVDRETREELLQSWFKFWVEDYDKIEEMYRWLGKQIAWLESEPNAVLDFVLEHDPYRI
ncbi:hypothetical protein N658DRAFT_266372 [Parathielavia hyrcaniae]|uniref:F-box domain-containing protein n=1 Tax=Parathielavia hyrcaniae TaxID=113614 RepID=A0AAN6SYQ9_9PEZI|nr:hypothetical protein N658DRAFT_266372 [Parathielavia hyrcaniae]